VLLTAAVVLAPKASSSTNRIRTTTRVASTNQSCSSWTMRTIASGLGVLENLTFDGQGSMFISATQSGAIERLTPGGHVSTVVPHVSYPGGLALRRDTLYFNTGNSPQAGILGTNDGTIDTYNLDTGTRSTWSADLVMPNGLAFLPGGDAVVTRVKPVFGTPTGMTRIPAAHPTHPQFSWVALNDTNGLMLDPTGQWLYTDQTFTTDSAVYRIRVTDPTQIELVAHLAYAGGSAPLGNAGVGQPQGLDDMGFAPDGLLYVAANGAGQVIQVDPTTGASCVIASGLVSPSSVRAGDGPGWPGDRLYVTSWDGTIRELIPSSGRQKRSAFRATDPSIPGS
jgi:sugar lactone lactonase YvrE